MFMFKSTRQISGFDDTSRELEQNTGPGICTTRQTAQGRIQNASTHYVTTQHKLMI